MMQQLKELVDNIVVCVSFGDKTAAMLEIARFTAHFERFLQQNAGYIFSHEMENLNQCMRRMLNCMETGDLDYLAEIAGSTLMELLDNWDFHEKRIH